MKNKNHLLNGLFSVLLVASIVLANVSVVFADDTTPPEPMSTETPTEEPTVPTLTGETEIPTITETPAPESTPIPEATPEGEETPVVEEQAPAVEEAADPALFEQIPENTEVVVLDENGNPIPLVSEDALNAILEDDPMWCPAGTPPGGTGCRNFTGTNAIANLLQDMRNNTNRYDENGIIYFTQNPGNGSFSLTTSSLGTSDFNTLKNFNLTLQGGWNGLNGASAAFTGQTNFGSNTLTIGTSSNPWVGSITMNDFTFSNVTNGNAVTVYTTSGDITLDNVDVTQQGGTDYTAYLETQSGDITVQDSTFDGNNSGANQSKGFHAKTNTGEITISDTTFSDSHGCAFVFFGRCLLDTITNYNGASLSAPTVTLNDVVSNNNDLSGIEITNANSIWLNNVVTTNNGSLGILGSGVNVTGTGSTIVNVNGGAFSNNQPYGVYVTGGSINVVSVATCTGNLMPGYDGCYNIQPTVADTTPPVLTLPANVIVEAAGSTGAIVTYPAPTAIDAVDGPVAVSCSPVSGSTFPIGTTAVNCSTTDAHNNTASGSFNVTVQDTTLPTLTLPADITTEATGPSGASVTFTVSASDLVDGPVSVICSPASGSTFPVSATAVNCSATDTHGNTANGTFNITVQDTTPPIIYPPANILNMSKTYKYSVAIPYAPPTTFDIVDGFGVATCTPAPGSDFTFGDTVVTCTAKDSHGNSAAPVTFIITVDYLTVDPSSNGVGGFIITVTGGELIDLDCFTIVNAFGVKVVFYNLCKHQSVITGVDADTLPGQLPDGVGFVKGLNITVLSDGEIVKELPLTAGVQLDFPITANDQDQYAALLWDAENKEWLDVTQLMKDDELAKVLANAEDALYQILPTETTKALYRILSTEKTGTFVIVKK